MSQRMVQHLRAAVARTEAERRNKTIQAAEARQARFLVDSRIAAGWKAMAALAQRNGVETLYKVLAA